MYLRTEGSRRSQWHPSWEPNVFTNFDRNNLSTFCIGGGPRDSGSTWESPADKPGETGWCRGRAPRRSTRRASAPGVDASRAPRTPNCRARDIRGHVDTGPSTNFVECFAKLVDGPVMTTYMICLCTSLKKQLYLRVMCTFKFRFASSNTFQCQLHVQYPWISCECNTRIYQAALQRTCIASIK